MHFALLVTPATLPRVNELRAAARPTGGKPPVLHLPEADAARDAARPTDEPPPPPGRWLVADVGPIVQAWDADALPPGFVYSCKVDAVPYVAPARLR
jgi:hypothetical protein